MESVDDLEKYFMDTIDSKMSVKLDYEKKEIDYTWLDIIEDTLRYIDNILKNPKKFIMNEEEIVKVELARRVTVESVIHLTQHTNLIQDIDKNGDVKPSKILNINKEESFDTYENRFIYTLIKQINYFLEIHEEDIKSLSYCHDYKLINYKASTMFKDEKVDVDIRLNSNKNVDLNSNRNSLNDRYKKIKIQLAGFMNSELMVNLTKLHVAEVKPPIRKTNLILKNPNFQKATELYNYLNNYENKNFNIEKNNEEYMEVGNVKDKFDESFLMNYVLVDSIKEKSNKKSYDKFLELSINRIIENLLESNVDIDKKQFDEIINKEYLKAIEKINNKNRVIRDILDNKFDRLEKNIESACNSLGEV